MAITTYTASGGGNTASGSVTVPAGMPSGSAGFIVFTQNNADALTATPAWLTLLDNTSSGSTSFVSKVYTFKVGDGTNGTVVAGSVATFTLSATRAWTATLYGADGVDTTNPITLAGVAGTASAATAIIPTVTTTEPLWLVEVAVEKANGSIITGFTPPTGWTQRVLTASPTTFGGAVVITDRDNGLAGAGTYGGDVYTPSPATTATTERYLIGFRPVPVTLTYYAPTTDTGATTTGWTKNPSTSAFYQVVGDTDPTSYAESPANPTNSIFEIALGTVQVPADLSTVSFQADAYFVNGTSGTAVLALYQNGTVKKTGGTLTLSATNSTFTLPLTTADANSLTKTGSTWVGLTLRATVTAA